MLYSHRSSYLLPYPYCFACLCSSDASEGSTAGVLIERVSGGKRRSTNGVMIEYLLACCDAFFESPLFPLGRKIAIFRFALVNMCLIDVRRQFDNLNVMFGQLAVLLNCLSGIVSAAWCRIRENEQQSSTISCCGSINKSWTNRTE